MKIFGSDNFLFANRHSHNPEQNKYRWCHKRRKIRNFKV